MESLLEPVELNRETTQALDEIRSGAENALYGTASADAEEKVNNYVLPLIEGSGLPNLHVIHYRWYLRELARHWRTRKGRDLAFHLELCIRKWVGLGLEPRTLQFLVCEAHQRLKGKSEGRSGNDECRVESAADTRACHSELVEESRPDETPPSASGRHTVSSVESVDSPTGPSSAESASSAVVPSGTTQSAESADVRSDPGILESSTPRILPRDLSFPGIMAGPRPPADSATGPLDSSNPGVL